MEPFVDTNTLYQSVTHPNPIKIIQEDKKLNDCKIWTAGGKTYRKISFNTRNRKGNKVN